MLNKKMRELEACIAHGVAEDNGIEVECPSESFFTQRISRFLASYEKQYMDLEEKARSYTEDVNSKLKKAKDETSLKDKKVTPIRIILYHYCLIII